MQKIVAYYRVSTKRQAVSGLGLAGQESALLAFAASRDAKIVGTYTETETGKKSDRPELAKAIAHAKRSKATLVVAKMDRLSRNVAFTSALMETNVDFLAVDNPNANRLTIHILAAVAENEAKAISDRTIAALAAAKRKGTLLGSARQGHWDGREALRAKGLVKGRKVAAKVNAANADAAYADLYELVTGWRNQGQTYQAIADRLNDEGHTTRRGAAWNHVQVMRVLSRAG